MSTAFQKFECNLCDRRMTTQSLLNDHIKHTHLEAMGKHRCPACPYASSSKAKLELHMKLNQIAGLW